MKQNIDLLHCVYESAELGRDMLGKVIQKCQDSTFRAILATQFAEYYRIMTEAEKQLLQLGQAPGSANRLSRAAIYMSLYMNMRIDATSTHLAEIVMQGNLMGLIDMVRDIKRNGGAEEEAQSLARRLLLTEKENMWQMQEYL